MRLIGAFFNDHFISPTAITKVVHRLKRAYSDFTFSRVTSGHARSSEEAFNGLQKNPIFFLDF